MTDDTQAVWPFRQMQATYQTGSRVIQWRMSSRCATCGGDITAQGLALVGEPILQVAYCQHCGASYTVDGCITD